MKLMNAAIALAALAMSQSNPAIAPVSRSGEDWWAQRHAACVAATEKGGFDVAFLGDSITQGWEGDGRGYWEKKIAPLKPANFGFSGDRTEHVLWRLANGELTAAKPKLIVIMIGTNNVGHGSSNAAQAAEGVRAIVQKLRTDTPASKILLLATFPRGQKPNDLLRLNVASMVDQYKQAADNKNVFLLDLGPKFISQDGTLQTAIMPDYLHLSPAGYQIWGDNMLPEIERILKLP